MVDMVGNNANPKGNILSNSYVEKSRHWSRGDSFLVPSTSISYSYFPHCWLLPYTPKTKDNAVMWVVSVLPTRVVNGSCLLHRWFIDCHDRGHLSFSASSSCRHYVWRASSGSSIVWCMRENGNGMVVVMISSRLDTRASEKFKWSNISQLLSFFCLSLYKQHGPYACTRKGYL